MSRTGWDGAADMTGLAAGIMPDDMDCDIDYDVDEDICNEATDEATGDNIEPELSPEELAFAGIAQRAEEGLADCDQALLRIQEELAEYDRQKAAREAAPEPEPEMAAAEEQYFEQYGESRQEAGSRANVLPENIVQRAAVNQEAYEREAFVRARLREARAAAANASWQLLLGFGLSFAVRVGVIGIWLGGWVDRHWLGDTGFGAAGIILLVIGYSFYMLYADLRRSDERWRAERERLQAEAEADFAAGKRQ